MAISVDEMEKFKLTINDHKYVAVCQKLKQSKFLRIHKHIKCHIKSCQVEEKKEYLIFRSKLLKFNIYIEVKNAHLYKIKPEFSVFRYETDFYVLRNILVMSYSQCFVPPLTPATKESIFDKKSLMLRERSFSRFLRGIIRCPEILNHELVIEFLTFDHKKDKEMKEFSKRLL